MITFIVHLKVRPENAPALEAVLTRVRDLSRTNEPGVVHYGFGRSVDRPDAYVVVEVYRDAAAHAAHMETAWIKDSTLEARRLIEGMFDIRQYVAPDTGPVAGRRKDDGPA